MIRTAKLVLKYAAVYYTAQLLLQQAGGILAEAIEPFLPRPVDTVTTSGDLRPGSDEPEPAADGDQPAPEGWTIQQPELDDAAES